MAIKNKSGITIVELLVVTLALIILSGVIVSIYTVGLNLWSGGYSRSDIRTDLAQALELVSKNLRQAKSIDAITESSITFTADLGSGDDTYRVYLYNSSDAEPNPPYSQDSYDLRWVSGTITYGLGANIATDIAQPTSAVFSMSGNVITIDMEVSREDESVRMQSKVRPRNL